MTRILVSKLLRDIRWPLLAVSLLLLAFSILWVVIAQRVTSEIAPFFNAVAGLNKLDPKIFEEVLFKGPGRVSQAVMGGGEVRFDEPTDFLAVEMLHPVILTLAWLWAVGRAAGAIAGELDRGTMELLVSQPVPRSRLILAHFIVDCVVIPVFVLSIMAGVRIGLEIVGPFKVDYTVLKPLQEKSPFPLPKGPDVLTIHMERQWTAIVCLASLMFAISGLAIAISSLNRSRWKAMGIGALVVIGMFILNVLGQLWEPLSRLRPISFFYYYLPQKAWLKADWSTELGVSGVPVLIIVGFLGYFFAWRAFERRDLPAPL
ncbi:hypothetical protein BH11PLA2_BH11PLA2_36630 [soil metagenome]